MSIWHKTKRVVKKKINHVATNAKKKRQWVMWEFDHVLSMCRVYMILNVSFITNAARILCNFMWNTNGSTEKQRTNYQISLFSKFSTVCFLYQIHCDQFLQKAISLTNYTYQFYYQFVYSFMFWKTSNTAC